MLTVKVTTPTPQDREFPKLQRVKGFDTIFLMTSALEGVVVRNHSGCNSIGDRHTGIEPSALEDFVGSITLSQV